MEVSPAIPSLAQQAYNIGAKKKLIANNPSLARKLQKINKIKPTSERLNGEKRITPIGLRRRMSENKKVIPTSSSMIVPFW